MLNLLVRALFLYLYLVFVLASGTMQMELFPGDYRCVGSELDQEDVAVFAFSAATLRKDAGGGVKQVVTATVSDPDGGTIVSNEKLSIGARPREIRENIKIRGEHKMCFELHGGKTPVRVFFHVDSISRNIPGGLDSFRKVGKDDIPTLEGHLKAAEDALGEISREIEFARRQEVRLREAGERTASRIQWFGILSMAILLSTSLWQLVYLRSFFTSKKLL